MLQLKREVGNAFRKSFSIELDWPQSSAWQQIKTLCNRVEVTRGAAKWITSEPFAAAHIRCATINLRRFHFAFIVQRLVSGIESVANVRVNCLHSLCIFQLSNCLNQIHVLTRIASASSEKCEIWKIFKFPILKPKWETRNHFKVIDTR